MLCVNMVEGYSVGDESSMYEHDSSMISANGDDSVVCVDVVEAPSAV